MWTGSPSWGRREKWLSSGMSQLWHVCPMRKPLRVVMHSGARIPHGHAAEGIATQRDEPTSTHELRQMDNGEIGLRCEWVLRARASCTQVWERWHAVDKCWMSYRGELVMRRMIEEGEQGGRLCLMRCGRPNLTWVGATAWTTWAALKDTWTVLNGARWIMVFKIGVLSQRLYLYIYL